MVQNLLLSLCSACLLAASVFYRLPLVIATGFFVLSGWQVYSAASIWFRRGKTILRFGRFRWDIYDFCRGWLITGQVGSGKTAAAINTMLWQVSKNCPTWGGVCVDDKGVYHETLSGMLKHLGRAGDMILLEVRPENAGANWQPKHTFNFLTIPHLPYSAKAKLICDVAASVGQRTDQSFFKLQAQVQMEFAFKMLEATGSPITLDNAYELLTSKEMLDLAIGKLGKKGGVQAEELISHYQSNFVAQPAEQLGGVKTTVSNYLKYFTDSAIAEVFCAELPTLDFDFDEIDRGKIVCVSIPQRYTVERRYINTLLKLVFYIKALRRFDRASSERAKDNLLIFWADEAQKIVTAAEDGMSDYNVVDVIREAMATVVAATQSHISLIPPMCDETKSKVFFANLANRITFRAADEDSAKIAADGIGKRKSRRRTSGWSGGQKSFSVTEEDRYFFEPHELRALKKFHAVVQHCERGFGRMKIPPLQADGRVPDWYYNGASL